MPEVLCAGIIVADHVCTPISLVPAAGELVMADYARKGLVARRLG